MKAFVNGRKIRLVPALVVDNKLIFLDKVNLFNNFFSKQYTPISNDSSIPVSIDFETRERDSPSEVCDDHIVKIAILFLNI